MNPVYRYSINGYPANPIIPANMAKEYNRENGQRYFRTKLSGKIVFVAYDFEYLMSQPFDTNFIFLVEYFVNGAWTTYYRGKFNKTDCMWDVDNKRVEATLTTYDEYINILNGLNKEFNLIRLNPALEQLTITKRPLIQIYVPGDNKVSCFLGGTYFEQDAQEITDLSQLTNVYKFTQMGSITEFNVEGAASPLAVVSAYAGKTGATYYGNNNTYKMTYVSYPEEDQYGQPTGNTVYEYTIVRVSDGQDMFKSVGLGLPFGQDVEMLPVSGSGATGKLIVFARRIDFYGRYLLDVNSINSTATYDIPINDIVDNNRNYKKCIGYNIDLIVASTRYSVEPTQFGINDYGTYFLQPYVIGLPKFYPIARSRWGNASYWFRFDLADEALEIKGRKEYILKDCYKISSVIKVLLNAIAPELTHEDTTEYSQFLYSTYNPISFHSFVLMLTQKSNITSGDYDKPAQKANIRISDVFDMLRDVFHCYWFIEGNKLRIEHIHWFMNGGSYSSYANIGVDLTSAINNKISKMWSFNTNSWSFVKDTMPERIQFAWMDDVTDAFDGLPIDIISTYVSKGNIENVQVSQFTTDIDYMLLNPSAITKDGFALFTGVKNNLFNAYDSSNNAGSKLNSNGSLDTDALYSTSHFMEVVGGRVYTIRTMHSVSWYDSNNTHIYNIEYVNNIYDYKAPDNAKYCRVTAVNTFWYSLSVTNKVYGLPFVEKQVDGANLLLQNGYLSWATLQPIYHVYDMPAKKAYINNIYTNAIGIMRNKKQTVTFPTDVDPSPIMLIKTPIGNGQVEKISINMFSRMNKVDLVYDTE